MYWHQKSIMQAAQQLRTSPAHGLSAAEAKRRLLTDGDNALDKQKRTGFLKKLLLQFKDVMVLLLIAAAVVSLAAVLYNGDGDLSEPLLIMAIVLFNGIVGVIQENKAENALMALKNKNPRTAKVLRDDCLIDVPVAAVVKGDIVHISSGDIVPADCRICECMGLITTEAGLTGESQPIFKTGGTLPDDTPLAERKNMVYMGTHVLAGSAVCMAVNTGMQTELGKIAGMLNTQQTPETPLQKRLGAMGKVLGMGAVGICLLIFVIGIMQHRPTLDMLMTAVSLAVAAIPEGLPAIVTVMLAIGVQTMAKENAVVRRLSAVEALGSATVICTDKTGTITQNKMQVSRIYGDDEARVLKAGALCTNAEKTADGWSGDPTEVALIEAAGLNEDPDMPRVGEIAFTSERKMMTGIFAHKNKYIAITKGAPEVVIEKCRYKNGGEVLTDKQKRELLEICTNFESDGLRVLAVAEKSLDVFCDKGEKVERELCFIGLAGLLDEPRPEACKAVKLCRTAGIRPIMITGDSPVTAKAVGRRVGIESDRIITGAELDLMDDTALEAALADGCAIFARTSPGHKLKIVDALKKMGHTAAMTGDACNDAPALKAADIGCAMGLGGTDVAREAADIVLTDDNFATIVKAVSCGRGIFANIKKAVHFLLSSNVGEIITVFSSMCFGFAATLVPVQLLWINLVTDSLPAIALGLEPVESDVMDRGPDNASAFFGRDKWMQIGLEGVMIGMLALIAGGIGNICFGSEAVARTMTFAVLSISQLVHAFNMRSERSLFKTGVFGNKWLVGAFVIGCILQAGVICVPSFNELFAVTALDPAQWGCVALLCMVPVAVVEAEKAACR